MNICAERMHKIMDPRYLDELKEMDILRRQETGNIQFSDYKIIDYPLGKYLIKIKLTLNNEFIGVIEIGLNKNFLSHKQKLSTINHHNVEDYYLDE